MRGKFIVIDGGEGTGTTTTSRYLAEVFGDKAIRTREPGGSPVAEKIRNDLVLADVGRHMSSEVMFTLFWGGRLDHMATTVMPALTAGKHVFCDRFDSSTWTYQLCAGNARHLVPFFDAYRAFMRAQHAVPDHYIILDGDPAVCLARAKRRAALTGEAATHFDERELAYHDAVRAGFLEFVERDTVPHIATPHTIVDATKPLDEVKAEVLRIVQSVIVS